LEKRGGKGGLCLHTSLRITFATVVVRQDQSFPPLNRSCRDSNLDMGDVFGFSRFSRNSPKEVAFPGKGGNESVLEVSRLVFGMVVMVNQPPDQRDIAESSFFECFATEVRELVDGLVHRPTHLSKSKSY